MDGLENLEEEEEEWKSDDEQESLNKCFSDLNVISAAKVS